jgi:hypothetical protein
MRFLTFGTLLAVAASIVVLGVGHPSALGKRASAGVANREGTREGAGVSSAMAGQQTALTPTPPPLEATPAPLPRPAPPVPLALPAVIPQSPRLTNHPKLAPPLARLLDAAIEAGTRGEQIRPETLSALPDDLRPLVQAQLMRINAAGEVQVYIEVENVDGGVVEALEAAGVWVERVDDHALIVQGQVPVLKLDSVASVDGVKAVRLPDYGVVQTGSVVTEGDSIIRADLARSSFHVSGSGVRVGVISDGVGGMAAAQATSDLPPSVDITTCNVIPGSDPTSTGAEGTAMLEIVHDIAPDAELWFGHFGMGTSLEFNAAVTCLAAHTDVVVDDVSWFNVGLYDGTGSVSSNTSTELNRTTNPIRTYSTSVANQAIGHYQGQFVDYGGSYPGLHKFQSTSDTTDAMELGPYPVDPLYLQPNGVVVVNLQWNDTFGASSNDYDLYLFNHATGKLLAWSENVQDGNDNPVEDLAYQNTTGAGAWFDIVIFKYSGSARTLDMFVRPISGGTLLLNDALHNFNTLASSVPNEADAGGGVISVGAIDAADPGNDTIETYSSRGPTNDGRIKPDVTGIDGVCVTGSGGFGSGTCQGSGKKFYGTSAAAPHAAGVAALLLQCRPDLRAGEPGDSPSADRSTLRNLILNNAVDLETSGMDNTFGAGRLDAYAAAAAAGCASTPTDTDGDGVPDSVDNCPLVYNPGQENSDSGPPPSGTGGIGNGTGIAGDDATIPNGDSLGDVCDDDLDNDGIPNASDPDPGGDITYDDNNSGNPCVPLGTDAADDGPSWDHNCNGKRDGVEGSCPLAVNPSGDDDGDGLLNTWEVCKWGTSATVINTDGDTLGDCTEVMDVDGNGFLTAADGTFIKQAFFDLIGKDGDFDINGNGIITNVDAVLVRQAFFGMRPCY